MKVVPCCLGVSEVTHFADLLERLRDKKMVPHTSVHIELRRADTVLLAREKGLRGGGGLRPRKHQFPFTLVLSCNYRAKQT